MELRAGAGAGLIEGDAADDGALFVGREGIAGAGAALVEGAGSTAAAGVFLATGGFETAP